MKKKFFIAASALPVLAIAPVVVSCKDATSFDNKVVFQTAQGKIWPLMRGLQPLVDIYNETQKGTKDFLPIELQSLEVSKYNSQRELSNGVQSRLKSEKNSEIPNLLLSDTYSAFVVNQFNRLLDFSNTQITKDKFEEKFYQNNNKIPGHPDEKIFAIPFDIATIDALVFNVDIMAHIFEQIIAGGGKVNLSANNALKQKTDKAKQEGNAGIPDNKIWKYLVASSNEVFKNLEVTDATFESHESLQKFASDLYEGLKLKDDLAENVKNELKDSRDARIFEIDYQNDAFGKYLYDKLGGQPDKFLWKLKDDPTKQGAGKKYLEYTLKTDTAMQELLKNTYEEFTKDNKEKNLSTINKNLRSIYYNKNGNSDWATWDIRNYETAFAYAPTVGQNQVYNTPFVRRAFIDTDKNLTLEQRDKKFNHEITKKEDVLSLKQVTKQGKDSTKQIFHEGGSSIVAVKTTEKRDKATIKFLEWLFFGDLPEKYKNDENQGKVVLQLRNTSSYVIPLKDRVNEQESQTLKALIDKKTKRIDELAKKTDRTKEEETEYIQLQDQLPSLQSVSISLEDLLARQKENKETIVYHHDENTSQLWSTISTILLDNTKPGTASNPAKQKTKEEFFEDIKRTQFFQENN
ncbi:LIPOPROTEIN [Mycoplasmopsis pulmonis]|uniref:LIPOPROTEIN n=1 Tax=Mycoplasmopsis pulmonis (strain UAB CTIP) TaxID=272635 RepID=Q98QN8_MYCPU|nr:lipoprotein [Mycoplasmopsis pulmonis]CAC13496.1 LIPOPROTEIN [Mycoplasmopsis pulmonis]